MRLAAAFLAALFLAGQDQTVPKFRSGVDVILLDVTVLDANRRPARGLKASDFTILEDGKPQPIVSFDEVDSPEPDGSLVEWMREVSPDVRTNYGDDRRLVLIVLDDANISFRHEKHVKAIGRRIVEQLGPADQAAVIYTGNNGKSQEFTSSRKTLLAAIERYADTWIPDEDMRGAYAIGTVDRAVETMIAIPHRRKAMILVSSLAPTGSDHQFLLSQAMRRAQRANVTIYPISPSGLEADMAGAQPARPEGVTMRPGEGGEGERRLAEATAMFIAAETGGFAVVNSNEFAPQIRQIFRETASYYLVGFQSAHRDGKMRRLEVKMTRPGLTARTRTGYEAPSDKKEKKAAKVLPLYKALSSVLPSTDIPMRVALAPFSTPGSRDLVAITLGVQQPVVSEDRAVETVELLSTAFNVNHRQVGAYKQTVKMTLRPAANGEDAKYEVLSKLELPPGRYNMRFAVNSIFRGKSGSVFEEVEVPNFDKEPLSMSGVVISVSPPLPSAPRDFLASVVPVQPTTQRVFMRGHKPSAFLRLYQGGRKPRQSVGFKITIVDQQDRTVHATKETLDASAFTGNAGVDRRFDLPIEQLAPGSYLVRFEAATAGKPITREVRFVVR